MMTGRADGWTQGLASQMERGQAVVEFAITSTVFVIAFLGIVYCSQIGILTERTAIATRMSGELNIGSTPMQDASLNSAYWTLSAEAQGGSGTIYLGGQTASIIDGKYTPECSTPAQSEALIASTPTLWAPQSLPTFSCDQTLVEVASRVGSLSSEYFRHYTYRMSATTKNTLMFPSAPIDAVEDYYAPASVISILTCDPLEGLAFSGSTRPPDANVSEPAVPPLSSGDLAAAAAGMASSSVTCGPMGVVASTPVTVPPPAPIIANNACAGLIDVTCFSGIGAGDNPDALVTLNLDGVQVVSQHYSGNMPNLVSSDSYTNTLQTGYQTTNVSSKQPITTITVQAGGSTFTLTTNSDGSAESDLTGAFLENGKSFGSDAYLSTDESVAPASALSKSYLQNGKHPQVIYTADGLTYSLEAPLSDIPVKMPNAANVVGNAIEIVTQNPVTNAVIEQFITGYKIGNVVGLNEYFVGYNMDIGGFAAAQAAATGSGSALQNWDFNPTTGYIQAKTVSGSF